MRVGIFTLAFESNLNYGAALQAWALKAAVEKILPPPVTNEMCVLPLTYSGSESSELKYCDRTGIINFIRKKISIYKRRRKYRKTLKQASDRYVKFEEFLKKNAFGNRKRFFAKNVIEATCDIDVYVIGSDWVWYLPENKLNADLEQLDDLQSIYLGRYPVLRDNQKRIAYAASQGIVPTTSSTLWQQVLSNFSAVSVREQESAKYLTKNGSPIKVEHVLDPTLLLEMEDLQKIEAKDQTELLQGNYIALYILPSEHTQEIVDYVRELSEKVGVPIQNVSWSKDVEIPGIKALGSNLGPSEFITYIKNSCYVITNSFHGMVFASLYHRRFTAFQRQENDFRQINLVRLLGLENRLLPTDGFKTYSELKDPFDIEVDWAEADERRRKEAQHSVSFLKRSILDGNTAH